MRKSNFIFNVPRKLVKRHYNDESILPQYRTEFMRDRDRIMYATAFRRLSGKTQIYTVGSDDHRKNRLTHTLEVAQIARTVAAALGFNCDLAEAIALGHDFGHTPFGHAGEQILHEIMVPNSSYIKQSPFYQKSAEDIKHEFEQTKKHNLGFIDYAYGFKHNLQSVRVAALLEDSYRSKDDKNIGLNLTNFALYGMMTHSNTKYDKHGNYPNYQERFSQQMKMTGSNEYAWSFEAYIVRWADDIAQWHHDLEDAMREGVLPLKKICETVKESLDKRLDSIDRNKLRAIEDTTLIDRKYIAELSHIVVNVLVNNLIETSSANLKVLHDEANEKRIRESEKIFKHYGDIGFSIEKDNVINVSGEINTDAFKDVIKASVHHSRNVERMNEKGKYIIRKLFEAYYAHPQQLPDGPILHLLTEIDSPSLYSNIDEARKAGIGDARTKFDKVMKNPSIYTKCLLMRRICDHIASMTDNYAIKEYNNLYG